MKCEHDDCCEIDNPTTKNDLALIHTGGLDEGIRCAMCTNAMKSDRGCDGSCVVDETMYKKVLKVIEDNIASNATTKNDLGVDCVSRQEVDRLACRYLKEPTDNHVAFYEEFLDLPSVTPIRPKGHWIGHREHCENLGVMPSGLCVYEWCSNCDCGIDVREWHRNHYNYCPNCGAKMESEE